MSTQGTPSQTATETREDPPRPVCAECLAPLTARHPRQLFCCRDHRREFYRRLERRGAIVLPLAVAERVTRGGTRGDKVTGRRARQQLDILIARYAEEDRVAGRMPIVAYMAERYRLGFEPI